MTDLSHNSAGRPVPDFVVIGAMRAGTTTLYELMRKSGAVSVPRMKETDYFMLSRTYSRGISWFLAQFDDLSKPICDISPNYARNIDFPSPPDFIHRTNPEAKLIYCVRDPIERAKSQYRHMYAAGIDMPMPGGLSAHKEGPVVVDASLYATQTRAYLNYFPIEQFYFVDLKELVKDQAATLKNLYDKLGVETVPETVFEQVIANTSNDVAGMPKFWGQLRRSPIGEQLRAITPRSLLRPAKFMVAKLSPQQDIPELNQDDIDYIRRSVEADAAEFRKLTGLAFEHWSV